MQRLHLFCADVGVRPQCRAAVTLLSVAVACGSAALLAQPVLVERVQRGPSRGQAPFGLVIEPAAPIADLFDRAEQGIARRDWKFVVDCLQRIIDDPQGSLLRSDAGPTGDVIVYESARRQAVKRLASLPPEGLYAYRLVYDGHARRLLDEARAARDAARLEKLVSRYLLTRYGAEAVDLLSSWALDEGNPLEALRVLFELQELNRASDALEGRLLAKMAASYAMLGRHRQATQLLSKIATAVPEADAEPLESGAALSLQDCAALPGPQRPACLAHLAARLPATATARTDPGRAWPLVGGAGDRQGRMHELHPTLHDRIPWRYALPTDSAAAWRLAYGVVSADAAGPGAGITLPVRRLVADERRLFVPTGGGCIALDPDGLDELWRSDSAGPGDDVESMASESPTAGRSAQTASRTEQFDPAFHDPVTGSLAVGFNAVLAVSRGGIAEYTQGERDADADTAGAPWANVDPGRGRGRADVQGTRLVALDADTGRPRWQRGRTGDPADPLDGVEFRSAPVPALASWWVPFRRHHDLYLAALDPSDGALRASVLLGTVGETRPAMRNQPVTDSFSAVTVASANGILYVPSGFGVLFAVDAADATLRWAAQYPVDRAPGTSPMAQPGWQSAQAVLTGGLVLLATPERSHLLAFSAADGSLEWSADCDGCTYVIAADEGLVWLGGRSLSARTLVDGQNLWTSELSAHPTGHAALCGSVVFAPTLEGLEAYDAVTGKLVDQQPGPSTGDPLGNPLCLGDSMYALGAASVRKLPDMARMYPVTLKRHESDPSDPAVAMRLAWLELMNGNARRAHEILSLIDDDATDSRPRLADAVAHARVEALLSMAANIPLASADGQGVPRDPEAGTIDPSRAEEMLVLIQQASRLARSVEDRLRCGLAEADQLARLNRNRQVYERLWKMGTDAIAETMVPDGDHVRVSARLQIARRLSDVAGQLSELQRAALRETAMAEVTALTERTPDAPDGATPVDARPDDHDVAAVGQGAATNTMTRLRAVAELTTFDEVAVAALSALASISADRGDYEKAEQFFREAAGRRPDPQTAATNLMHLCRLYRDASSAGLNMKELLSHTLTELDRRFADVEVPPEPHGGDAPRSRRPPGRGAPDKTETEPVRTVSDWVRRWPSRLVAGRSLSDPVAFSGDVAWVQDWTAPGPNQQQNDVTVARWMAPVPPARDSAARPTPTDRVVVQDAEDRLYCYQAETGQLLWQTRLRLPGRFEVEPGAGRGQAPVRSPAAVDGQTAVFSNAQGLFAVGLITGRRLWAQPYEGESAHMAGPPRGVIPMAVRDGRLAAAAKAGRLTMLRVADGAVLWERDLRGEPAARVWQSPTRVLTADENHRRVNLFSAATGQSIARIFFRHPDMLDRPVQLLVTDDLLIGPRAARNREGIVAVNLETGAEVWHMDLNKPLVALFDLHEGFIGVSSLGGEVDVVEAATGASVYQRAVSGAHAVIDGAFIDGTLLILDAPSANVRFPRLVAEDIATGEVVWSRDDVLVLTDERGRMARIGAALATASQPAGVRSAFGVELTLRMLDTRTGETIGEEISVSTGRAGPYRVEFSARPHAGVALFTNGSALYSLQFAAPGGASREGL